MSKRVYPLIVSASSIFDTSVCMYVCVCLSVCEVSVPWKCVFTSYLCVCMSICIYLYVYVYSYTYICMYVYLSDGLFV